MPLSRDTNDVKKAFLYTLDINLIKNLIDHGLNVSFFNHGNTDNNVALTLAVQAGKLDTVKFLLDKGANVNSLACSSGHRYSDLPVGAEYSALCIAAGYGHKEIAELLIEKGAQIEHPTRRVNALFMAANRGKLAIVKLLTKDPKNINFNIRFNRHGNCAEAIFPENIRKETVKYLQSLPWPNKNFPKDLDNIVDNPTEQKRLQEILASKAKDTTTPITSLISTTDKEKHFNRTNINIIKLLIENGLNVSFFNEVNTTNNISLFIAIGKRRADVVKILLDKGANVDSLTLPPNRYSALYMAAIYGDIEIIKLLIEKRAQINHPEGGNALSIAANSGNLAITKLLSRYAANININITSSNHQHAQKKAILEKNIRKDTVIYLQRLQWLKKNFPKNWEELRKLMHENQDDNIIANYLQANTIRDKDGNLLTALAIKENNQDIIDYLIENDILVSDLRQKTTLADTDILSNIINDANNKTIAKLFKGGLFNANHHIPLINAIVKNNYRHVEQLIKEKVNLNFSFAGDGNDTPLHIAAKLRHMTIVDLLVEHGANLTAINNAGNSPLDIKRIGIIRRLVRAFIKLLHNLGLINRDKYPTLNVNPNLAEETKTSIKTFLAARRERLSFRAAAPRSTPYYDRQSSSVRRRLDMKA